MLKQQILKTIQKYDMFKAGERALVGVSGGADSVALLLVLHKLSKELKLKLFVASLDHMFRGKEAEEDINFVERLAAKLKLPFITDKIDVPQIHRKTGGSREDIARRVRYEFFIRAAIEVGADKIALGHTKDDQAETVLMRLIYGAGMAGLGGIPPTRKLGKYLIIRPLIETPRNQIDIYLKKSRIKPRIDSSNLKDIYRRNKIRNSLLPVLQKGYNPNIKEVLARTAESLRDDYDLIYDFLLKKAFLKYIKRDNKGCIKIKLKDFGKLHIALKKYLLRECIKGLEYRHWQLLERFIAARKNNSTMHLPGGWRVGIDDKNLVIARPAKGRPKQSPRNDIRIEILSSVPSLSKIKSDKSTKYLDADKISLPLKIRFRKPGDRFMPLGMQRYKKLQDFFVDRKIPVQKRDRIPLVISKDKIVCVGNIEISDFAKITPATKRVLAVKLK